MLSSVSIGKNLLYSISKPIVSAIGLLRSGNSLISGTNSSASSPIESDSSMTDDSVLDYAKGLFESIGEQNAKDREYNSAEAEKNRAWQTEMSNTSYQRARADLEAAGLNPLLALNSNVGGASTGSSASASHSSSGGDSLSSIISAIASLVSSSASSISSIGKLLLQAKK